MINYSPLVQVLQTVSQLLNRWSERFDPFKVLKKRRFLNLVRGENEKLLGYKYPQYPKKVGSTFCRARFSTHFYSLLVRGVQLVNT